MSQTSQETSAIFQRCQKVTLLVGDWRISIHVPCFCLWMSVTIMIDGSVKRNHKYGFVLQSSHVIEKRYKLFCASKSLSLLYFSINQELYAVKKIMFDFSH